MAKERRQSNKQITVETLNDKLEEAIAERIVLAHAVEEIHEKVNYDGGLVYQCDLKELNDSNTSQHTVLMTKIAELDPLKDLIPTLEEMVENQKALQHGSKMVMSFLAFLGALLGVGLMLYKIFTGK